MKYGLPNEFASQLECRPSPDDRYRESVTIQPPSTEREMSHSTAVGF